MDKVEKLVKMLKEDQLIETYTGMFNEWVSGGRKDEVMCSFLRIFETEMDNRGMDTDGIIDGLLAA